jgi:zinc protease
MSTSPLNRNIAPTVHSIKQFDLVKPQAEILANGLRWNHIQAGKQTAVSVQLIFRAGTWFAPSREIAAFTARMLNEGTSTKTSAQIAEEVDKYGSFLEISSGNDYATIEVYALSKYLAPMLALVKELLTEATFPEKELQQVKDSNIQNIKVNNEKTSVVASAKFRTLLFGDNTPYGVEMMVEEVERVQQKQLVAFYQEAFYQQPFEVLSAGNLTDSEKNEIRNFLNSLTIKPANKVLETPKMVISGDKKRGQLYLAKDDALQSSIRIGKPLFLRTSEDYMVMRVLNEILGGYFGSRLMSNIREEKGYTYSISSSLQFNRNAGYLIIGTDVKKEVKEETKTEIFKEMQILCNEKVPKEELAMVKNYMKGAFVNSLGTPFAIADKYRNMFLFDLPADYYQNYLAAIDAVTAKELQEMAKKYLHGDFVEVVVG